MEWVFYLSVTYLIYLMVEELSRIRQSINHLQQTIASSKKTTITEQL